MPQVLLGKITQSFGGAGAGPLDWLPVQRIRRVTEWIYRTPSGVRWSITDRVGTALADGASWHETETGARQQLVLTLREILRSDLPGVDLEVARHLAALSNEERAAVVENANEIRFALLRNDADPVDD